LTDTRKPGLTKSPGARGIPSAGPGLTLPRLPYALDALEPHLSRRTLAVHHGQHHAAYVEKTRALVTGTPLEVSSLEEIVRHSADLADRTLFQAAAQAWNHAFYWQSMKPGGGGEAHGDIAPLIENEFGSHRNLCEEFMAVAVDQFGSGWVWLVLDGDRLRATATSNAETPLTGSEVPLLVLDVWEHAYYLDYEHRRPKHVAAFLAHLANWEFANANLRRGMRDMGQLSGRRGAEGHGVAVA
jgi:Fe-Mn family superoxide dismutase